MCWTECSVVDFHLEIVLIFLQGLTDPSNYHEFCRLMARLKTNYQLGELVKVVNYPELIKRIAEFTVTSLRVRRLQNILFEFLFSIVRRPHSSQWQGNVVYKSKCKLDTVYCVQHTGYLVIQTAQAWLVLICKMYVHIHGIRWLQGNTR